MLENPLLATLPRYSPDSTVLPMGLLVTLPSFMCQYQALDPSEWVTMT